jgi:hypothetical protein
VGGDPDTQRRRRIHRALEAAPQTRGDGISFEHVVASHEVDGPQVVGLCHVHHRHEVAPRQLVHLGERLGQHRRPRLDVDAGGPQHMHEWSALGAHELIEPKSARTSQISCARAAMVRVR